MRSLEVRLRYRKRFEGRSEAPLVLMTRRRRLDAFLVEQAAAAGADFRDGVTIEGLTIGPDGAELTVGGKRVGATAIVGADGVNGSLARAAGIGGGIVYGIALEGNGPLQAGQQGRATVELGVIPGGYGWVFPKDGHANYGVGGWASEGPRLREHLRRLCDAHGVDSSRADRPARPPPPDPAYERGPSRARPPRRRRGRSRRPALRRRHLRGARLRSSRRRRDPRGPARRLRRGARARCSTATPRRRGRRSSRSTVIRGAAFAIARLPGVWRVIAGLVSGDVAHPRDARGLARPPLRLLARL